MKRLKRSKTAKLISMTAATLLIALILASSLYYSSGNLTAHVIAEDSSSFTASSIREINFNELKYLSEGWYELRNGYIFYIESFGSYAPLNLKVKNPAGLNGFAAVDANGNIEFSQKMQESAEYSQEQESQNMITGEATGLEGVTGLQVGTPTSQEIERIKNANLQALGITDEHRQSDGSYIVPNLNGKFNANTDGSIYFVGIQENNRYIIPPQTYTNGKWYYAMDIKEGQRTIATRGSEVPLNVQASTERKKNGNLAIIRSTPGGLTKQSDGTYKKTGVPGYYKPNDDGSIYYTGDTNNRLQYPAQTFVNGKWYSTDGRELVRLENRNEIFYYLSQQGELTATINGVEYKWDQNQLYKKNGNIWDALNTQVDTSLQNVEAVFKSAIQKTLPPTTVSIPTLSSNVRNNYDINSLQSNVISARLDTDGNYFAITKDGQEVFIPKDGSAVYTSTTYQDGSKFWQKTTATVTNEQVPSTSNLPDALRKQSSVVTSVAQPIISTSYQGPSNSQSLIDYARGQTSQDFLDKTKDMASRLNVDYVTLLQIMYAETGGTFSPAKLNGHGSGATGLIQFLPSTARDLGTTTQDLAKMSAVQQLEYVEKYLAKIKAQGKDLSNPQELAAAIIYPDSIGQPSSYVIARRGSTAYAQNQGLDKNNNGEITKEEYTNFVFGRQVLGTIEKSWEVLLNDGKTRITVIGQFQSAQDVATFYNIDVNRVKSVTGTATGLYSYEIYARDGTYLETIKANSPEQAKEAGERIARDFYKTEYGKAEQPKFKLTNSLTGLEVTIPANSESDAREIYKKTYGVEPDQSTKLSPGSTGKLINYYIINERTGQRTVIVVESSDEANKILADWKKTEQYKNIGLKLEKVPTLEDLIKANPTASVEKLQKELQNYLITPQVKAEELTKPKIETITLPNGKKVYYLGNERFEDESKAKEVERLAIEKFNKEVTETYAAKKLDGKKLLGEVTPDKWLLARDSKGNVYQYVYGDDPKNGQWNVIGSTNYKRQKTIGTGSDAITVTETVDIKSSQPTRIEATKGGITITLDQAMLRQIEQAGGKDAVFGREGNQQKISFTHKNGNLVEITQSENYGEVKDGKITGTKTQEVSRTVFVDENGKYLTPEQAAERKKENLPIIERKEQLSKQEEKDGKPTTYILYTPMQVKRDGKYITIIESRPINRLTGKREGNSYSEEFLNDNKEWVKIEFRQDKNGVWHDVDGNPVTDKDGKVLASANLDPSHLSVLNTGKKSDSQYKSRQFFANLERVFTEYRGLGYIPGLFMDEKRLLQWRHDVDKFFSENYLGIESWTSKICEEKIEHGQSAGVAYAETPQGLAQIGAHIEATRTQPIVNLSDNSISYIYKITFNVRNGDYETDLRAPENMSINVFVEKDDGSRTKLFNRNINVDRGKSFGRMGSSAIVKETKNLYSKVCIKFDKIPVKWKVDNKEICNIIQESSGEPTTIQSGQAQQRADELNDF